MIPLQILSYDRSSQLSLSNSKSADLALLTFPNGLPKPPRPFDPFSREGKEGPYDNVAYRAGSRAFFVHGLWMRSGEDLFDDDVDNPCHSAERYEDESHRWLRRNFLNGLNTQRHMASSWLRYNCSSILGVSESDLLSADTRNTNFREEIGWTQETGLYSSVDVPILHKDWHGKSSLSSIFLNVKLMGIYVALVHGLSAGKAFMNGKPFQVQTRTMAQIHDIRNITPGAIATCAVLARWVLSADDALQEVGSRTGIQYFSNFEEYLMILETGLEENNASVISIIEKWNEQTFPGGNRRAVVL